ncbi:MAG: hypothetical protein ACTSSK_08065 [Candidatus Heimdallarchaeota archaeon]
MDVLFKIPIEAKAISTFLEEEQNYLRGLLQFFDEENISTLRKADQEIVLSIKETLITELEQIYPLKDPQKQIIALTTIADKLAKSFKKTNWKKLNLFSKWVALTNGYMGRTVDEEYEIAILLYLISAIYQIRALETVQTSHQYRYYHISALSAIKGALDYMDKISPNQDSYGYPFYQMLQIRKLEIQAEITKAEAFIERKKGDFERASKLFAGAASFRFAMMSFELPESSDNRVKIYASTELGMACFYIAVGMSNKNELENAYLYLLKARSYFTNAAKLSENNTELLEAANKRLDLVNPYIDRIKDSIETIDPDIENIPDPQPIMLHPDPEPILSPSSLLDGIHQICSNCLKKVQWSEKCSECGKKIIPVE